MSSGGFNTGDGPAGGSAGKDEEVSAPIARSTAMRCLLLSSHPTVERAAALRAVAGHPEATVVGPGTARPDPRQFDVVVLDGSVPLDSGWVEDLMAAVRVGTRALILAEAGFDFRSFEHAGLSPLSTGVDLPEGEWMAKVANRDHPATRRAPAESALWDRPLALELTGSWDPVVNVNVALRDHCLVADHPFGEGRVAVSGLGRHPGSLHSVFLQTTLRRLLSFRPDVPNESPLGMAIVGYGPYGGMGLYHGMAAEATQGLELVAVCDSEPERRKAAERDFAGVRAYGTLNELASDPDVDVVVVATPPSSHVTISLDLLRAGKHVACEKPLCFTVAEADLLESTATGAGVSLTVNQNRRWDPDFLAVKRAVESGSLGQVFNFETFVGGFEHPCRAWHSDAAVSGGAIYDWGSHYVDWTLQLMRSSPSVVRATGQKRVWHDVTNLDQVRVHMLWDDGREAEFVHSDVAAVRRPKFYLQGTAGTLSGHYRPLRFERLAPGTGYEAEAAHHAEAPVDLVLSRYEPSYGLVETVLPPAPPQRFAFHRNLADHLHFGEPLAVTVRSVKSVVAVLEAATESAAKRGASIVVPGTSSS